MVDSRYILTLYPLNNKVKEKVCVKNMQLSDSIREIKGIGQAGYQYGRRASLLLPQRIRNRRKYTSHQ